MCSSVKLIKTHANCWRCWPGCEKSPAMPADPGKQRQTGFQGCTRSGVRGAPTAAVLFKTDLPVRLKGFSGMKVTIDLFTRLTLRASPLDIGWPI